ncbi:hypothetical protein [Klebsiella pneumoniae IS46]|nr:hypothetical protein CSC13_0918 [Klebsiella pneumoniae]CDL15378.1 hypothetical protein [Klebsiella pneumoniae IS46]
MDYWRKASLAIRQHVVITGELSTTEIEAVKNISIGITIS